MNNSKDKLIVIGLLLELALFIGFGIQLFNWIVSLNLEAPYRYYVVSIIVVSYLYVGSIVLYRPRR